MAYSRNNPLWEEFKDPVLADWKRLREYIQHEDLLIGHRMTWLILSSGVLFTAFFSAIVGLKKDLEPDAANLLRTLVLVIPFVGLGLTWTLWRGIEAARDQLVLLDGWWNARLKGLQTNEERDMHPPLRGINRGNITDKIGFVTAFPITLLITWLSFAAVLLRGHFPSVAAFAAVPEEVWWSIAIVVALIVGRLTKKLPPPINPPAPQLNEKPNE